MASRLTDEQLLEAADGLRRVLETLPAGYLSARERRRIEGAVIALELVAGIEPGSGEDSVEKVE